MIQNIYSIKDNLTGHENLMVQANDPVALRFFRMMANEKGNKINIYAGNMELWRLGSWDTATGKIQAEEPVYMATAAQLKEVAADGSQN